MKSAVLLILGLLIGALVAIFIVNPTIITKYLPSQFKDYVPMTQEAVNSIPSNSSASPSATPAPTTIVQAGTNNGKTVFGKYQLSIPSTWTYNKDDNNGYEILTISKGQTNITISQLASSGSICVYPGDPDPGIPFVTEFKSYVELTSADSTKLRKSFENENSTTITVCSFSQGNYQSVTPYGYTSIKSAASIPTSTSEEIDQILSSLKKI